MSNTNQIQNTMISVRLNTYEKEQLERVAKEKGTKGITGLLRLITKARKVDIEV